MDSFPLISIGIPTRNRLDYLKKALESALSQSYENIEIIISDNASTDSTLEWSKSLEDKKISFYRQNNNIGMVNNWNFCLEKSKGSYFLLLSDDDILHFDAVKNLIEPFFTKNISISYGKFIVFTNESILRRKILNKPHISKTIDLEAGDKFTLNFFLGRREIYPCGILFKKSDLENIGYFPTKFQLVGDAFAWMSIVLRSEGFVCWVKNAYIGYRIHPESQTLLAKNSTWTDEISYLHHFFESNLERSNLQDTDYDYRRYKFRNKIRILKYSSLNPYAFLRSFYLATSQMKPPIIEVFQSLIRWSFLIPVWSSLKKFLKLYSQ
jgi:glycosyltransferase involved in cell wall biosynthesis